MVFGPIRCTPALAGNNPNPADCVLLERVELVLLDSLLTLEELWLDTELLLRLDALDCVEMLLALEALDVLLLL